MTEQAWKQEERKIARTLGGERNPLSGSNSRHTSGDVIQTPYYVDAKLSGAQSDSGARYYTLERETVVEVQEKAREEEKDLGLMTVRYKHCSDRYAIIPTGWCWSALLPEGGISTYDPSQSVEMTAQGTVTHRLQRNTLQKLEHIWQEDAGPQVIWHKWADSDNGPEEAIITWESLLWLLDVLEVCPEGCQWQATKLDGETECPDCGILLESGA